MSEVKSENVESLFKILRKHNDKDINVFDY